MTNIVSYTYPWEGAKLFVIDAKGVPKPVRVLTWIPELPEDPVKVLKRLKTQNTRLRTRTWKVVDRKLRKEILLEEREVYQKLSFSLLFSKPKAFA